MGNIKFELFLGHPLSQRVYEGTFQVNPLVVGPDGLDLDLHPEETIPSRSTGLQTTNYSGKLVLLSRESLANPPGSASHWLVFRWNLALLVLAPLGRP